MKGISLEIVGLERLKDALKDVTPRVANNILRGYIADHARILRSRLRSTAPVGPTGNLKKSIFMRMRRSRGDTIGAEVYTKGQGYHWHLVEYGTKKRETKAGANRGAARPKPFVRRALSMTRKDFDREMEAKFVKRLKATLERELKKKNR